MSDLADESPSLLEWATRLAVDPQLRARLAADPRGLLDEQGFTRVPPADLHHALPLVTDSVAARLGRDVDGDLVEGVDVQRAGEHPVDALARQFVHVSEAVLAAPVEEPHDLDALDVPAATGGHGPHPDQALDPTALLDDLPGLHHPGPPDVGSGAAEHFHDALPAPTYGAGSGPTVATAPAAVEVLRHPVADLHPDVAVVADPVPPPPDHVDPDRPDPDHPDHPDHADHTHLTDHTDHTDPMDHAAPGHDVLDL